MKQTLIAFSTMQAKFTSCYGIDTHTISLKNLISKLNVIDSILRPLRIYSNNFVIVLFSKNNKTSNGSKHVDINYLVIKGWIKNGDILVKHIDTKMMITELLTKAIAPIVFR